MYQYLLDGFQLFRRWCSECRAPEAYFIQPIESDSERGREREKGKPFIFVSVSFMRWFIALFHFPSKNFTISSTGTGGKVHVFRISNADTFQIERVVQFHNTIYMLFCNMIWGISNTEYSLEIGFKIHKSYVTCSFVPIVWHEFSIGKISGRVSLTFSLSLFRCRFTMFGNSCVCNVQNSPRMIRNWLLVNQKCLWNCKHLTTATTIENWFGRVYLKQETHLTKDFKLHTHCSRMCHWLTRIMICLIIFENSCTINCPSSILMSIWKMCLLGRTAIGVIRTYNA